MSPGGGCRCEGGKAVGFSKEVCLLTNCKLEGVINRGEVEGVEIGSGDGVDAEVVTDGALATGDALVDG